MKINYLTGLNIVRVASVFVCVCAVFHEIEVGKKRNSYQNPLLATQFTYIQPFSWRRNDSGALARAYIYIQEANVRKQLLRLRVTPRIRHVIKSNIINIFHTYLSRFQIHYVSPYKRQQQQKEQTD